MGVVTPDLRVAELKAKGSVGGGSDSVYPYITI